MGSRLISVAGGRNQVRVYEAGEGAPLMFLHGAGGLLPNDPFVAALAKHYRVHAPVLPGYEDSEGADRLRTMLDVTLFGFDVIGALGLDQPILVGHSMGGMIAAEMAATAPQEVTRLGLIAPAGLWLDSHPLPDLFAMLPFEWPSYLFNDVAYGTQLLGAGMRLEDPKFLNDFMIANSKRLAMAGKLLFPIPDRGLAERLYRVEAKTVVVWGENDRLIPATYGLRRNLQARNRRRRIDPHPQRRPLRYLREAGRSDRGAEEAELMLR
jgi:pimeloyl-ACP methyl ester carboxylesterase